MIVKLKDYWICFKDYTQNDKLSIWSIWGIRIIWLSLLLLLIKMIPILLKFCFNMLTNLTFRQTLRFLLLSSKNGLILLVLISSMLFTLHHKMETLLFWLHSLKKLEQILIKEINSEQLWCILRLKKTNVYHFIIFIKEEWI